MFPIWHAVQRCKRRENIQSSICARRLYARVGQTSCFPSENVWLGEQNVWLSEQPVGQVKTPVGQVKASVGQVKASGSHQFVAQPEMGSNTISGTTNFGDYFGEYASLRTSCVRHPVGLRPWGVVRLTAPQMALRRVGKPCMPPLACGGALQTAVSHPALQLRRGRENIRFSLRCRV